jgi:hypothetical protein
MEFLLAAIMFIESGGDPSMIGAHGERGPLQIKRVYWNDACRQLLDEGVPRSQIPMSYDRWVCNQEASMKIVRAYWRRFCPQAYRDHDWATLARVHNGGPEGERRFSTADYCRRVQAKMWQLEAVARRVKPPIIVPEKPALPTEPPILAPELVTPAGPATLEAGGPESPYLSVFASTAATDSPQSVGVRQAARHRASPVLADRTVGHQFAVYAPYVALGLILCLAVPLFRSRREPAWSQA